VILRYPRDVEFRLTSNAPKVGDVFTRNGDDWIVEKVEAGENGTTHVTLRPVPKLPPNPA
jgi:hypothetical protein